jgi:hypothetical protein
MYVEMYGPDGAGGRWDVEPPPGKMIDEAERDSMLAKLRRPSPHYPDSHVEWADCGTDLVFGYFYGGERPKAGGPKHTRPRNDDPPSRSDPTDLPTTANVPPPP